MSNTHSVARRYRRFIGIKKTKLISKMSNFRRFSFKAEWFQSEANVMREFIVNYYPDDNGIEIFDQRVHKAFMKRTRLPNVNEANFYPGAKVSVFGRQIRLIDYADDATRKMLANRREKTFCIIKSHAVRQLAEILKIMKEHEFIISNCAMVEIDSDICEELMVNGNSDEPILPGVVVALELVACDAVRRMQKLLVSHDCTENRGEGDNRGIDLFRKSVYSSPSANVVAKELQWFFGTTNVNRPPKLVASYDSTTLAVIKPHALQAGHLVDIISEITTNGFIITALKMFDLGREHCEEFYEVYKGVVSEYLQMALELSSGKFIAIEIGADNSGVNVYKEFRQLCGPSDPVIARQLYPQSIRAKFGVNKVQNAIHCTDLEEDCKLEVEYFFKILSP